MWHIEFYETDSKKVPVESFLDSIKDVKLKAKMIRELELLEQFGNQLSKPHTKPIKDNRGKFI